MSCIEQKSEVLVLCINDWFAYEAVSDQGLVWFQSVDKTPRASKSDFENQILIFMLSLLQ